MDNCGPNIYEAKIDACAGALDVIAGLPANKQLFWLITDRHGNIYQRQTTTDSSGKLVVDLTALPAGVVNQFSGKLLLELRDGGNYLTPQLFTFSGVQYGLVLLIPVAVDRSEGDTHSLNTIK